MPEIEIVSDGTPTGTKILCGGKEIVGVSKVTWQIDANSLSKAVIIVDKVAVKLIVKSIERILKDDD